MTYNIQIGVNIARNPRWQLDLFNLAGAAEVISAQQPDVVALQEVDCNRTRSGYVDQARWLGEKLGYHYGFASAYSDIQANGQTGHYGNAILSRYPIAELRVENLWRRDYLLAGEPNWVIEPRCCFVARLEAPQPICVLGTHLSTSPDQQQMQLPQLATIVQAHRDTPLVLMGDFNTGYEVLQLSPLPNLLTNTLQPTPTFTFPNGLKARSCIDHVMVSEHWTVDSVWVVSERRGVSDHNPVVADLTID
jgi:endonuclease/exonuclease/phosphatase family metal-dependent hydrolase